MIALLLLGCTDVSGIPIHFDGPAGAAWLPESADLPFAGAVGFVSNSRSGTIVPLDLVEGRILSDDPMASFLRASPIATGRTRQLRDVEAFASEGKVMVWSLDVTGSVLVQAPYISGVDGDKNPEELVPTVGEATFVDADGSNDDAAMKDLSVRAGFTTSETWSIEYDGTRWWAKGSHSGTQNEVPVEGEPYTSDFGEIGFTISGSATAGDRFEVTTDAQVSEWSFDGRPMALLSDGARLYVGIDSATPLLGLIDPWTGAGLGSVALPADAHPWRMARSDSGTIYVADAKSPVVYVIDFPTAGDASTAVLSSIATAGPVLDVAWQAGEGADGAPFENLFVAPVAFNRVDVYDLTVGAWHDPNPADVAVQGIDLGSPVAGLAATVDSVVYPHPTTWGALARVPAVAVSTQDGFMFLLDGQSGCAVITERGPHGPNPTLDSTTTLDWAQLNDMGPVSNAALAIDDATDEQITVSPCGGVARGETWTVTYDSAAVSWKVEGTISGVQVNPAFSDQRYVSDNGAVSFLIQSGSAPATDGDNFEFAIDRGLVTWSFTDKNENSALDGTDRTWEAPSRPLAFDVLTGPSGGGWDDLTRKEYAILPMENTDIAARVLLDEAGKAELAWE